MDTIHDDSVDDVGESDDTNVIALVFGHDGTMDRPRHSIEDEKPTIKNAKTTADESQLSDKTPLFKLWEVGRSVCLN